MAEMGQRIVPYQDTIQLDGKPHTGWEEGVLFVQITQNDQLSNNNNGEVYIKYWKPAGTTDQSIRGNLIDALQRQKSSSLLQKRIFSVGRLDQESTGLLLLTSDGRIPNAVLRKQFKNPKTYRVLVDKPILQKHIQQWQSGIVITTDRIRRQGKHESFTAKTLPCQIVQLSSREMEITLIEGRNRQICVMMKKLGYNVVDITLDGLHQPGEWKELNTQELNILQTAIQEQAEAAAQL